MGESKKYLDKITEITSTSSLSERIDFLKEQDKQFSEIATRLGFTKRIHELESENAFLRIAANELEAWKSSRTYSISRFLTYIFSPLRRITRKIWGEK